MTMDLHKLWAEQQAKVETPSEWNETDLIKLRERSDSPIRKLKRNIQINSAFAIVFAIGFIALIILIDGFWFRIFTTIVTLAYISGMFFNRWIIKKYLSNIPFDDNLLHRLKAIYIGINKSFRAIEYSSILIYPIAMTAGFLIPLTIEGKLEEFNQSSQLWIILGVCYVVLTPICFWIGRVLNRMSFGKYLKQIEGFVSELEQGENSN
jgi:uncharacterized membrane protein YciS (DUF1049 family)